MRDPFRRGAVGWGTAAVALTLVMAAMPPIARAGRADDDTEPEQPVPALERSDYWNRDGLADVPSPVREALEAWVAAEFALERPATPEIFAAGFVDALVAGGLSEEDAVRTVAAFAVIGHPLTFADRRRVTAALAERCPRLGLADSLTAPEKRPHAALPPGGVVVEYIAPRGNDSSLLHQRSKRRDRSWTPRDAFDLPIEVTAFVRGFNVGSPGVTGEDDTLRIDVRFDVEAVSRTGERESLYGETLRFAEPAQAPNTLGETLFPFTSLHVPKSVLSLPDDSRIMIEARYEVTHHAPGVKAEDRAAVVGTVRFLVVPRRAPGDDEGVVDHFDVVPLGSDGEELPCPGAISWRTATNLGAFVLDRKPLHQERVRQEREQEKSLAIVGRDLDAVPLLHGADGMPGALSLPAERTHLILLGATWCGPCRALAPAVSELVDALEERENAPIVHRLSIDDDPESFAAALESYPSGVCTEAFEEDLLVDGVPKYYLVRGGKVVEHGFVDEERIASWRATFAP